MHTKCPHCGQPYEVEEKYNGCTVSCEECNKDFIIVPEQEDELPYPKAKQCLICGRTIPLTAEKCHFCQNSFRDTLHCEHHYDDGISSSLTEELTQNGSALSSPTPSSSSNSTPSSKTGGGCPLCHSTQIFASKKGVSVGNAVVGHMLFGTPGLLAGAIGKDKVIITCLTCGHQWYPGGEPVKPLPPTVENQAADTAGMILGCGGFLCVGGLLVSICVQWENGMLIFFGLVPLLFMLAAMLFSCASRKP